jgi:hypothetical protein
VDDLSPSLKEWEDLGDCDMTREEVSPLSNGDLSDTWGQAITPGASKRSHAQPGEPEAEVAPAQPALVEPLEGGFDKYGSNLLHRSTRPTPLTVLE